MAFADQLVAIETHAIASGAALTPAMSDVSIGLPVPRGRCARIYWDGESEPVRMGTRRDITGELVSDRITVSAFWPVSSASETQYKAIVTEMYGFKHELRTRVLADSQLGGQATDLEMDYAEPDFQNIGGTWYAVVSATFTIDYTEYPIAP